MENPYCPQDTRFDDDCAFVGRDDAYQRIHQYLSDPVSPRGLAFLGGRHIGKSALLWHLDRQLDEDIFGVFIPLRQDKPQTEADLLKAIVQHTLATFSDQHIVFRSGSSGATDKIGRVWFAEQFLPKVFQTIRAKRRLLLLLDDVDVLIDQIQQANLAEDFPQFLSRLLVENEQLGVVMTLNDEREPDLAALHPLAEQDIAHIYRLPSLTPQASAQLMNMTGVYTVDEDATDFIHRATGGQPILLQWFGYVLYETAVNRGAIHQTLPVDDVREVLPSVVERVVPLLHENWQRLTLAEQLVLTAVSHYLYRVPQRVVTVAQIERWLVETDYPLNETAIQAAVRGLDYHQLVYKGEDGGIRITSGMMQTWLLNHAQLDEEATPPQRWVWGAVIVAILALTLLLASIVRRPSTRQPPPNTAPTVTLENPAG